MKELKVGKKYYCSVDKSAFTVEKIKYGRITVRYDNKKVCEQYFGNEDGTVGFMLRTFNEDYNKGTITDYEEDKDTSGQ